MSIASEIAALQQDKADISAALLAKGATLPSGGGGGFDDFASMIRAFPVSQVEFVLGWATTTPQANEPFIRDSNGFIQYMQHTFSFQPKGYIFSCAAGSTQVNANLPEISGKNMRSVFTICYIVNSYGELHFDYAIHNGLTVVKTTTQIPVYSSLPTGVDILSNTTVTIGRSDSSTSSNVFRFAMTDSIIIGSSAGVPYQLFAFA